MKPESKFDDSLDIERTIKELHQEYFNLQIRESQLQQEKQKVFETIMYWRHKFIEINKETNISEQTL